MPRNKLIQVRRGTAAQWADADTASTTDPSRLLADGEPGYDTTNGVYKIGDGASTWADLPGFLDEPALNAAIAGNRAVTALSWDPNTIVCLGDSWTQGNQDGTGTTYPGLLQSALSWASVINAGKGGWTSTEIATRWGAPVTVGAFTTATDATTATPVAIVTPTTTWRTSATTNPSWLGELRLPDGTVVPGTLAHNNSTATWSDSWTFTRTEAGAAVTVPAGSQFICTELDAYKNATMVISVGRNNFTPPSDAVRDVNRILAARTSPSAPFIVLAVPTASTEGVGTLNYQRVAAVNASLAAAFPDSYIDHRRYLTDLGLKVTATAPTTSDLDQVIADTLPGSLMIPAGDHPNQIGYKAMALCILNGLTRAGAVIGASAGVAGTSPTAFGQLVWDAADIPADLGATVNEIYDRKSTVVMRSISSASAPTLARDNTLGRRYLSFDGVDDQMLAFTGNVSLPFTIVAKARLRSLAVDSGIAWSNTMPGGVVLYVSKAGAITLSGNSTVATSSATVAAGAVLTLAAVANGASSSVGPTASLTNGDIGTGDRILGGFRVGYASSSGDKFAALDLFQIRILPWALTATQIAAVAAQMG